MQLQVIHNKIYDFSGEKVMLDFDLAELYQIETKYLKRAVKANIKRFPKDFIFELTREEFLRCNFSTSKRGGTRYLPFAFTEHGVTMLASILNSDKAIEMNIAIIRAFIALRKQAIQNKDLIEILNQLKNKVDAHDEQFNQIYETLENLLDEQVDKKANELEWKNRERIGFKK